MSDLIDTTEMYLRTIFELEEEGIVALRARIAERLGHSGPTVSQTVARMERDGLLHVSGDRHLELTDAGRSTAVRVMRKHRLAERLLLDVIGLEWEHAHDEACRWEHVISERVERKIVALLADPRESPYGNPIPGLDELGGPPLCIDDFRRGVSSLTAALRGTAPDDGPRRFVLRRLGEPVQTDTELMSRLAAAGIRPASGVSAVSWADTVSVRADGESVELPRAVAAHVFVQTQSDETAT
ncbi:MAG: DtxR family transcriptional regulator, Mn-dependent transcriptional regulator [Actinomycetota bacterium]|nr:DtxR family transcriptional regulator, Mn-dependent transcriptional regulator [Actinomycetota bacterium]